MNENNIDVKVKAIYRDISDKEKKVADYFLKKSEDVVHQSIRELATTVGVSESTIFRVVQKLGYSGFKEFKLDLAISRQPNKNEAEMYSGIFSKDSSQEISDKVFALNIKSLQETSKLISKNDLERTMEYINQCKMLYFFGIGGSSSVAIDAYHKFIHSPLPVMCDVDSHIQLMKASKMSEDDCAIVISHGGQGTQINDIAEQVKATGAKVIVITSFPLSPLAKLADVCLLSTSQETIYQPEAMSSRISQLSILDVIFVNYMVKNEEKAKKSLKTNRKVISLTKTK